ncbi:GNAT family N-acetyltransferase [Streptomyces griseoluteus]
MAAIVHVPDGAMTIDYLIGDPRDTGQGIGTAMLQSVIVRTWAEHPAAPCVLVPPSWRALARAGLRRIGVGDLQPDNPVDDRTHYLYRVDRPGTDG